MDADAPGRHLETATHKGDMIMLPDPLHPAVIQFPIVLAALLPLFAVGSLVAIRRGTGARRGWALTLALAAVLAASAWFAVETGEAEEDRVEEVVGEAALHEHEEAAERFLVLAGSLLLVAAVGLAGGTVGTAARYVATLGTLVVLYAGVDVGDAGGELVYRHGAASAYTADANALPTPGTVGQDGRESHDDDD
jgi:uncharacterized membrane protein